MWERREIVREWKSTRIGKERIEKAKAQGTFTRERAFTKGK